MTFMRGTLNELSGDPSSGKTSLMMCLLAKLTQTGEICAVVDSTGGFDPRSAFLAGVQLENLLWIRCGGDIEKAFTAADYLVQAKGFGAVWLNLGRVSNRQLRLVPKTYWYRYRTRVKETPTLMLVTAEEPVTGPAAQSAFVLSREKVEWSGDGRYKLLKRFDVSLHSRKEFYGKPLPTKIEFDYTDV